MVFNFSDSRILNFHNPSKMSSCGIFRHEQLNSVPLRIEFLNIIISWNDSEQVGIVLVRIMAPSDTEVFVDQVSNLSVAKETVLFLCLFCSSRLIFLLNWELWMILFRTEAILASSTSNFGIETPRIDDEDLNSSTESTNSTSLIHCFASVGNCEQVHTSVLNLIFQQAKVAGVGNLSK